MHFVFDERPSESSLVELIWRTQSDRAGSFISAAVSHWEMVIWRENGTTGITVRGPETKASLADCPPDAEFLGVTFRMGVFMPHLPVKSLVDSAVMLPAAGEKSFWLHGAAWQFPDFNNADTFVNRLVRQGLLVQEPVVEAALNGHHKDLSSRSMQRRFLQATGLTQGAVYQIARARQAAGLLRQGTAILDVVEQAGYFDQPHLTRSLKRFVGQTPAQIQQQDVPTNVFA